MLRWMMDRQEWEETGPLVSVLMVSWANFSQMARQLTRISQTHAQRVNMHRASVTISNEPARSQNDYPASLLADLHKLSDTSRDISDE
jgi:hypothetical protein